MILKADKYVELVEEAGLPPGQAWVPPGFFFGWAVEAGLHNAEEFEDAESLELLASYRQRRITAPALFAALGGVLDEESLNAEGYEFAEEYVGYAEGQYFGDFNTEFADAGPTRWHVADTWENYDQIKACIERRYRAWRA